MSGISPRNERVLDRNDSGPRTEAQLRDTDVNMEERDALHCLHFEMIKLNYISHRFEFRMEQESNDFLAFVVHIHQRY